VNPDESAAGGTEPDNPLARLDETTRLLEQLRQRVARGKPVPMSASVMVNRAELLADLDALAAELPAAFEQARRVVAERDRVIADGHAHADRLLEAAKSEQHRLVCAQSVHQQASSSAEQMLGSATDEASRTRSELEDYVDRKLATFEVVLTRTLAEVTEGRHALTGTGDDADAARTSPVRRALRALRRDDTD